MDSQRTGPETKKPWEPLRISSVGHVSELVLGGGGKGSPSPADPGEIRKPPGQAKQDT